MIKPEKTLVIGHGGGGKSSSPPPPTIDPNTLQANTTVRIVDVVCEGQISSWGVDDNIYKSTYLNEVPVMNEDGTMNFQGVTLVARKGTETQAYLPGFDAVESEASPAVNTKVTKDGGPVSRTFSDTEVDDIRITMKFPRIVEQTENGDLLKTDVAYRITVTPDNGAGAEQTVKTADIHGKCMSEYRKRHLIENISQYGAAPWVVKVYRDTEDATDDKLLNESWWYSYTEIINAKLRYPNSVVVGLIIDMQQFGTQLPSRKYRLKGRMIQYPSNYNPVTRKYAGIWDGTFVTGYCNNPAWVVYDMLTNNRFGLGRYTTLADKDKWALYAIAQRCDGDVSYTDRVRNPNGGYSETTTTKPRFTFNGVIQSRAQALALITHICSTFMGFPIWSTGAVSFVQDSPRAATRIACPANVANGFFEYEGTDHDTRKTVAKVSFTDINNFNRSKVSPVVDKAGVARYGYNPADIVAFGCNNPYEATLRGRYFNYSNLQQTDIVSFVGGMEWADAIPGEIIEVQDPHYANKNLSGRFVAATATSITVDRDVEIEPGVTYTLLIQHATEKALHEVVLTNTVGTTRNLTWATPLNPVPAVGMVWVLSSTAVGTREFKIFRVGEETDGAIPIKALEYDSGKYALVEQGIVVEAPPEIALKTGKMEKPGGISIQPYTYTEGDHNIRKYGVLISWGAADDPRVTGYEVIASFNGGDWERLEEHVAGVSYDVRNALSGTYDIGVRSVGLAGRSQYVYYHDFNMQGELDPPSPPTHLVCVDHPAADTFSGKDCEISWSASAGSDFTVADDPGNDIAFTGSIGVGAFNVAGYKIEVLDGTTLIRTHFTEGRDVLSWVYTYEMNVSDHDGAPVRVMNFKVFTVDVRGVLSEAPATLTASNPAPTMATLVPIILPMAAHLDISWPLVSDNDMAFYQIKADGAEVGTVNHPEKDFRWHDVEVGTIYTIQIVPHDVFGPGIGSQTNTGTPVKIPAVNLDVELSGSIEMSDSDSNTEAELATLYDGQKGAGGVTYTLSGTDKFIQYKYTTESYFDRIALWVPNAGGRVYAALSDDGSGWTFYKADADHTVDSGAMAAAVNQADARTNYLQLDQGLNVALLPNNLIARYVRLYLTGTGSTIIHEFVPSRILISELAAIQHLSSLSSNIGLIEAGMIRSADGNTVFDLDAGTLSIGSGTGYSNFSDRPKSLRDLDGIAGDKLDGIEPGADVTDYGQNINGANLCPNSGFSAGLNLWHHGGPISNVQVGVDLNDTWKPVNGHAAYIQQTGSQGDPEAFKDLRLTPAGYIPVEAGKTYCFSVYTGAHRCKIITHIGWYDASGNHVRWAYPTLAVRTNDQEASGGKLLSGYKRLHMIDVAPSGSATARLLLRKHDTVPGQNDSYAFFTNVMFSEVHPDQTVPPAYQPFGTDDSDIRHASDNTKIDGGKIHPESGIVIRNGASGDYCHIHSGDISFYQFIANGFREVKSLKRIDIGSVASHTWKTLSGYWASTPSIWVCPAEILTYNASFSNQSQKMRTGVTNVELVSDGVYRFKGESLLETGDGSANVIVNRRCYSASQTANTASYSPPNNTRKITASVRIKGCHRKWDSGDYNSYYVNMRARLRYWTNGAWHYTSYSPTYVVAGANYQTISLSTPTTSKNIAYVRLYVEITGHANIVWQLYIDGHAWESWGELDSITCTLAGGSVITTGSLGYIAIGG